MKKLIGFLVLSLMICGFSVAQADQFGGDYREFSTLIRHAQEPCRMGVACTLSEQSGLRLITLYTFNGAVRSRLNPDVLRRLHGFAREQAVIWADTILEGDFVADGVTRLEGVQGVFQGEEFLGFRIVYSERAWYVGNCGYDSARVSTLAACRPGRIYEASYVSRNLTSWMRDETALAHFAYFGVR